MVSDAGGLRGGWGLWQRRRLRLKCSLLASECFDGTPGRPEPGVGPRTVLLGVAGAQAGLGALGSALGPLRPARGCAQEQDIRRHFAQGFFVFFGGRGSSRLSR